MEEFSSYALTCFPEPFLGDVWMSGVREGLVGVAAGNVRQAGAAAQPHGRRRLPGGHPGGPWDAKQTGIDAPPHPEGAGTSFEHFPTPPPKTNPFCRS